MGVGVRLCVNVTLPYSTLLTHSCSPHLAPRSPERAQWEARLREAEMRWETELAEARSAAEAAREDIRRELEDRVALDAHDMVERVGRLERERDHAMR